MLGFYVCMYERTYYFLAPLTYWVLGLSDFMSDLLKKGVILKAIFKSKTN